LFGDKVLLAEKDLSALFDEDGVQNLASIHDWLKLHTEMQHLQRMITKIHRVILTKMLHANVCSVSFLWGFPFVSDDSHRSITLGRVDCSLGY